MDLKCSNCGKKIETLPISCGYSLSYNEDTDLWECYMENCGFISIKEILCDNCCKKKNIST